MADTTGISWADATFNPWIGCSKVSPGCAHCYAETLVQGRMGRPGTWGDDGVREITVDSNWKKPLRWARLAEEGMLPDGKVNRDGHRPRIFCASLADAFEDRPEVAEARLRLVDLICATPELDWLLLTKRPEFARDFWAQWRHDQTYPESPYDAITIPTNVWMGVSIENSRHTYRADVLREIPAAVRFISAEPLLGSLITMPEWRPVPCTCGAKDVGRTCSTDCASYVNAAGHLDRQPLDLTGIDWVISGGESGGRNARPMHPDWLRELRDACAEHDVAFHGKQWGAWRPCREGDMVADVAVEPSGRVLPFLNGGYSADAAFMVYAGSSPKSGGKLLDGTDHCAFPGGVSVAA